MLQPPPQGQLRKAEDAQYCLDMVTFVSRLRPDPKLRGIVIGTYNFPRYNNNDRRPFDPRRLPIAAFYQDGGMVFRPAAIPPKGKAWELPWQPARGLS